MKNTGLIIKAYNSFFFVECNGKTITCTVKGNFKRNDVYPCVGDYVIIDSHDDVGIITEICDRKNHLIRPLLSNVDNLVIVASVTKPAPNFVYIDKMVTLALINRINPIVVISKSDLSNELSELYSDIYKKCHIDSYSVTIYNSKSIFALQQSLSGKINAFSGNSGVGKSSIIHSIFPDIDIETGEISTKLERGKHTTRKNQLYKYGDCYIADTPGFSSFDFNYNLVSPDELQLYFPEISDLIFKCRFSSCKHISEPGCYVKKFFSDNPDLNSRYNSYVSIFNELQSSFLNKY